MAAITARAEVRNTGVKPPTAIRVAGSEALKITTPIRPLSQPLVCPSHRLNFLGPARRRRIHTTPPNPQPDADDVRREA